MRNHLSKLAAVLIFPFALRAAEAEKVCCPPPPAPPPPPVVMTLRGEANLEVAPDEAKLRFFISHDAVDLQEAKRTHNEQSLKLAAVLHDGGAAEEDIRSDVAITREVKADGKSRTRSVTRYRVRTDYEVTLRKLDRLDVILDGLISSGVKEFQSVSFGLSHPEERMKKLRLEAIADARAQADGTVQRIGVRLGRLVNISGPPGVGGGNASISGASGFENQYIIGGVNVTNSGYGVIGQPRSLSSAMDFAPGTSQSTASTSTTTIDLDNTTTENVEPVFTRPGKLKIQAEIYLTYELADLGRFSTAPAVADISASPRLPLAPAAPAASPHRRKSR